MSLGLSVKERRAHVKLSAERYGATVAHLRRIFLGFPFFCLLTPGVEAAEAVFKGVQFVQITLSRLQGDRKGRPYHRRRGRPLASICLANDICMWLYYAHGRGRYTALLLLILFLMRVPETSCVAGAPLHMKTRFQKIRLANEKTLERIVYWQKACGSPG
jgi:hypothetical protein